MAIDTSFFDLLRLSRGSFFLNEPTEASRLGNGEMITASLGAALWRGEFTAFPQRHSAAAEIEARIAVLQRPGEFFTLYDRRACGPRSDLLGTVLGGSSPTIYTLDADNKRLTVDGLPAGYEIQSGDYIGWEYGSNPERKALHRVVTGAIADGGGRTPLFEVAPHIRTGVTVGTAVSLVRPTIKARLLSVTYGRGSGSITDGAQITFTQTLR
jgi:hypothetical protein